jgi:hypothetical protein
MAVSIALGMVALDLAELVLVGWRGRITKEIEVDEVVE